MEKIVLTGIEPAPGAGSDELANVIISRIGLIPRKKGSTEKMNKVLIEMYERAKISYREKKPSEAVMTVEEMANFAGITRQTMYEYLRRWQALNLITKTSYIGRDEKVVIGYRLNGPTLESAFEKAKQAIVNNLDTTIKLVDELQKALKNEKISQTQKENKANPEPAA
ncbi:MAG: helix-turn-helix domain-containing protein [Nanoarchaeota archaeon]